MLDPSNDTISTHTQTHPDKDSAASSSRVNVNRAERGASLAAGTALVILGLRRRGLSRILLSSAGVMMVLRGASGQCPAYRALGLTSIPRESKDADAAGFQLPRPIEPLEPMVIEETIAILGAAEDLRESLKELPKLSAVLGDKVEIGETPGGELEWHVDLPFERTLRFKTRWTDSNASDPLAWETLPNRWIRASGSLRFDAAPADLGTTVRARLEFETLGPMATINLGSKLLEPIVRKLVRKALRRFKSLAETGEVPTNAIRVPDSSAVSH